MGRRVRRRIIELERAVTEAQLDAARLAQDAQQAKLRAQVAMNEHAGAVASAESLATERIRSIQESYDQALGTAGVLLFQQINPDEDAYYVSGSSASILGWEPGDLSATGALRGIVHPEDVDSFDHALRHGPDTDADTDTAPGADTAPPTQIIDLRGSTDSVIEVETANDPKPTGESKPETITRLRTAKGDYLRFALRMQRHNGAVIAGSFVEASGLSTRPDIVGWFAELVENDPAACVILQLVDPSDPASMLIRAMNASARRLFNAEEHSTVGHSTDGHTSIESILSGSSAQLVRSAVFDVHHTGESMTAERLCFTDIPGTYLDMRVERLSDGTIGLVLDDVTNTVALETRLLKDASHDALTGLPSRRLLEERLASAVDRATSSSPMALILLDIVGLNSVNDDYGMQCGDDLLVQVGRRLIQSIRGISVVSRLADDEFAVLTLPMSSRAEAVSVASAVAAELTRPFDLDGHLVDVAFSIGVATAPQHGDDSRSVLRNASAALRSAKNCSEPFVVFEASGENRSIRRLAVLSELRQSLADNQLELRFQPQLDLRSGRVTKVEAVPRWIDEDNPARMSVELLELAEQSALIQPMTRWLLSEATRATHELARQRQVNPFGTDDPLVVAVNLSTRNLFQGDFETFVNLLLDSGELQPEQIEVEVGETGLTDDPGTSQETLARLAELGISFVVDEFGTGYTSLATMQLLPVRGLKIDRSYVSTITTSAADAAVIRSTIELSHELGLFTAATGVTDLDVLAKLAQFGCDYAQGPFLSAPVKLSALPGRIAEIEDVARSWLGATTVLV